MTESEKKLLGELQQLLGIAVSAIHRSWHECQIVLTDRLTEIANIRNRINQMLRASEIGDDTNAPDPLRGVPMLYDRMLVGLKELEWSSIELGQGSGPHGSGRDGTEVRACVVCHGIDPTDPAGREEFNEEAQGHKADCWLALLIAHAEALT